MGQMRGLRWQLTSRGGRSHTDTNGRCLVVKISYGRTGRKVETTGARVGDASVGGR